MGSAKQLKVTEAGDRLKRLQKLGLISGATLWFLLFWWSDWDWWPGVIYAGVPMVIVILPGIRRLVDESWGLVVGLWLFALQLQPEVDGPLLTIAWGATVTAASAATFERGRHGWRRWLPWVGVAVGALLAGVALLVWLSGEAERDAAAAAAAQQDHQVTVSKLLPSSPRSAVMALVEGVAVPAKSKAACWSFSETAAAAFAVEHQAADCVGAMAKLRPQIRNFYDYVNQLSIPTQEEEKSPAKPGQPRHLDACHLEFTNIIAGGDPNAGPQIGMLTFVQQYGNGWLITDYQPCSRL